MKHKNMYKEVKDDVEQREYWLNNTRGCPKVGYHLKDKRSFYLGTCRLRYKTFMSPSKIRRDKKKISILLADDTTKQVKRGQ